MYNDNDDDDNDDKVIIEDINEDNNNDDNNNNNNNKVIVVDVNGEKEENDELDNHDYSRQGIFRRYTNYGYISHRTTTNKVSINTNETVDINE